MKRHGLIWVIVGAIMLVGVGCSSSSGSESGSGAASGAASKPAAAPTKAAGADFCSLLATQVAQTLTNIDTAMKSGPAVQQSIAAEVAKKAPVTQAELEAAAPPEPRSYLDALAKTKSSDITGAAGDAMFDNLTKLNNWAIANCDSKYRSIFTEYKGVIGG